MTAERFKTLGKVYLGYHLSIPILIDWLLIADQVRGYWPKQLLSRPSYKPDEDLWTAKIIEMLESIGRRKKRFNAAHISGEKIDENDV